MDIMMAVLLLVLLAIAGLVVYNGVHAWKKESDKLTRLMYFSGFIVLVYFCLWFGFNDPDSVYSHGVNKPALFKLGGFQMVGILLVYLVMLMVVAARKQK